MSQEMITISVDEYNALKKISDAANYCVGWIAGCAATDKTRSDLRGTIETVQGRLERAINNE